MLRFVLRFLLSITTAAHASTPALVVETPSTSITLTRGKLLAMTVDHLQMSNSRAYLNILMSYQAVKLCDILRPFHILPADTVELISTDNFSVLVPAKVVMNCSQRTAVGYVAIEPENKPWPRLKYNNPDKEHPDDGTAGPFAVIWLHPEKSYISNEYWAWKLVKIKVHHQLDHTYLHAPETKDVHIVNGYHAYVSRCAGCHTMNKIGKGVIGPDLNTPRNPTEYFASDDELKRFVRDPQSVRPKTNDRMSGTSAEFLSEGDLGDLIGYLRYMARR